MKRTLVVLIVSLWASRSAVADSYDPVATAKACDAGDIAACYNLGTLYLKGTGVPRDLARAAALFDTACNGGDAQGCFNLALGYQDGAGVVRDQAKAMTAALVEKACASGDKTTCENAKGTAGK